MTVWLLPGTRSRGKLDDSGSIAGRNLRKRDPDSAASETAAKNSEVMSDGYKMEKKRGERMYCRKCGAQLPKHAKFCRKCGTAVPENHTGEAAARYGPTIAAFLTVMLKIGRAHV